MITTTRVLSVMDNKSTIELYTYPATSHSPGWPEQLQHNGETYVRLRDGSPLDEESQKEMRDAGVDPDAIGNEALYAILDEAGLIQSDAMYGPMVSQRLEEGFPADKSKLVSMTRGPWVHNSQLEASELPTWSIPSGYRFVTED